MMGSNGMQSMHAGSVGANLHMMGMGGMSGISGSFGMMNNLNLSTTPTMSHKYDLAALC